MRYRPWMGYTAAILGAMCLLGLVVDPVPGMLPEIKTFLRAHPEFGEPISRTDVPDWANGKRQRVQFVGGRDLLFYTENGQVRSVHNGKAGDATICARAKTNDPPAEPDPLAAELARRSAGTAGRISEHGGQSGAGRSLFTAEKGRTRRMSAIAKPTAVPDDGKLDSDIPIEVSPFCAGPTSDDDPGRPRPERASGRPAADPAV